MGSRSPASTSRCSAMKMVSSSRHDQWVASMRPLKFVPALLVLLLLGGCALAKARPARDSGFIPPVAKLVPHGERAPFHGYWVRDAGAFDNLKFSVAKIHIAPVDISYALKAHMDSSAPDWLKVDRREETEELGRYFAERLRLNLSADNATRVKPVSEAEQGAIVIRLALVEVVPTNPGVNAVGTAAGFFVPGSSAIKLLGEGSVAIEGYLEVPTGVASAPASDGSQSASLSAEVWEAFKDREGQKLSAFSLKDYQQYAHIRVALDDWSRQIAELLNSDASVKVEEASLISLNPL